MMRQGAARKATGEKGVYEVVSETKTTKSSRGKTIPDVCYYIAIKLNGKLNWEKIGWLSDGYSVKVATDIRADRMRSLRHGEELPQQKRKTITLDTFVEQYLKWSDERINKRRGNTKEGKEPVTADRSRYRRHLQGRFGGKRMDEISTFDLERMKSDMSKEGASPKTISHCLGLLRSMYNRASDWNLYDGPNPVQKIKMPVVQNARDRFLSVEEVNLLLKELRRNPRYKKKYRDLEDPKLHDMTLLSLHTGARASEIFNLKVQDVNFQRGLLTLRDTKNTETRFAPMTSSVQNMLKRRIPDDKKEIDLNAYVFTDNNGMQLKEISNAFERVISRLGFNKGVQDSRRKVVFHTLRHTFASWLAIEGTPIFTIAKLMGHKSIAMSERYSHLSPDHKRQAIANLEKAMTGKRSAIVSPGQKGA